jgi:outer membrane lipase/esterase
LDESYIRLTTHRCARVIDDALRVAYMQRVADVTAHADREKRMNRKFFGKKNFVASVLIFAGVLAFVSEPAAAQSFDQFVGFGDSTIDSGSYRSLASPRGAPAFNAMWAAAVAAGAGKPTSSPGLMSSEALAAAFGLSAVPADQGGTNYATSGAKNLDINSTGNGGFGEAVPTVRQIGNYLAANGGRANPNALYLISSGGNDIGFATGNSGTGPFPQNPQAYLISAAQGLASAVAKLHAAGARFIVVPNQPFSFDGTKTQQARLLYSQTLWSSLTAAGVNFIQVDYNAMLRTIFSNPAMFGIKFVNADQPACTQPAGITTAWALLCSSNPAAPSHLVAPDADQTHLFADDQHLSTAGQKILADYERSLIVSTRSQ